LDKVPNMTSTRRAFFHVIAALVVAPKIVKPRSLYTFKRSKFKKFGPVATEAYFDRFKCSICDPKRCENHGHSRSWVYPVP
jgi:hypothetical protein